MFIYRQDTIDIMRSFTRDNTATGNMAFIIPVILIGVILIAGSMSTALTIGINELLTIHNDFVDQGITSEQTSHNIMFIKNIFRILGVITIIGSLIWGKVHSTDTDTFVDASLLIGGILTMYLFTFFSMILVLVMGTSVDVLISGFTAMKTDMPLTPVWEAQSNSTIGVNVLYLACHIPMITGITVFILAAINRTTGESEYDIEVSDYQNMPYD
jgi:hypothetical protein